MELSLYVKAEIKLVQEAIEQAKQVVYGNIAKQAEQSKGARAGEVS